jgi:hypothetical protein
VEEVSPVFHHRLKFKNGLSPARFIAPLKIGKSWLWPLNITEAESVLGERQRRRLRLTVEVTAAFATQRYEIDMA